MIVYSIIVLVLTILYVFLFLLYLTGWLILPDYKISLHRSNTKVSIIIPVRNEEPNIRGLIEDLLKQRFPAELFEIIVVDDFSEDRTAEIVSSFQSPQIRLMKLREFITHEEMVFSYKKKALEAGIENATGELIITTDADCRMNDQWILTLVNFYQEKQCHMIVAPVLMKDEKSFFSTFQSLDYLGLIGITGATLHLNFPTMCNGANLAFRKKSYVDVNGYEGISMHGSGDDMLLMHKMAKRWKNGVMFLKNEEAVVFTKPMRRLEAFINQRMRWTSKSKAYRDKKIILNLVFILVFNFSILISFILSFFNFFFFILFLTQFITKAIMDFAFLSHVTAFFRRQKLMWLFLPVQMLHILYIVIVGFAGNVFTVRWKGRMLK